MINKLVHTTPGDAHQKNQASRLDPSWLIYAGLLGVIVGTVVALAWSDLSQCLGGLIVVAITVLFFCWRKLAVSQLLMVLMIGLLLGQWRAILVIQRVNCYQPLFSQMVRISGRLTDDVSVSRSGSRLLRLSEIKIDNRAMVGEVLIITRQKLVIKRGDYLTVTGKLEVGQGKYRAKIKQISTIEALDGGDFATDFRDWLEQRLRRFVSGERADLVSAIVLGKRTNIQSELNQQIRITGLSHIVVASGLHLMIVVGLGRRLFNKISRRWEWWGSLILAGLFALTAGLTASMTRALGALVVSLMTWFYGRKMAGWRVIILLIAGSLLINPLHLSGDLSWWLSYGAFFGVLVAVPIVQSYFFDDKKLSPVSQLLLAVVVVQVVVAPILLINFNELSLISPLSNLLIVPLLVMLMWLAGLLIMVADISWVAWLVAYPLQLISQYILSVMLLLAQFPRALIKVRMTIWQIGCLVILIILALTWMSYQNWRLQQLRCLQKNPKSLT